MAKVLLNAVTICAVILNTLADISDNPPPCDSDIYCIGGPKSLLHTMQMARIDKDSKTFVDKKLKYDPVQIKNKFKNFMTETQEIPSKEEVQKFMAENFDPEGSEFEDWNPSDWKENPAFLNKIVDPELRDWAKQLNEVWKELGRKIKEDVKVNDQLYSQIYLPNPVVIPGGRFREVYYWDTYWIVQGLLHSEMYQTVRGMLENFFYLVHNYNKVPNGGRIYYQRRSQPALLIPMAKIYMDATDDKDFLRQGISSLEKEYLFWKNNRMERVNVDGKEYQLAKFKVLVTGPRPESYREDYEGGQFFTRDDEREQFYINMKTAAESGWDFSTRWMISEEGTNKGNLTNIRCKDIIPVDLNAYMCMNARLLSEFYSQLEMTSKAQEYSDAKSKWQEAIDKVLWDEKAGVWLDYDLVNKKRRNYFYPSNISPLFALCYNKEKGNKIVPKILKYLEDSGSLKYPGGVPTSMNYSGQQWDFPNAWPPLQHIVVVGLNSTGNVEAQDLAFDLAKKWVQSNYKAFKQSNKMFEKYNVTVVGLPGGGGEYETVTGFGWTNGVILDFLDKYGDRLTAVVGGASSQAMISMTVIFACLSATALMAVGLLG